jgi:hypothetical protein
MGLLPQAACTRLVKLIYAELHLGKVTVHLGLQISHFWTGREAVSAVGVCQGVRKRTSGGAYTVIAYGQKVRFRRFVPPEKRTPQRETIRADVYFWLVSTSR